MDFLYKYLEELNIEKEDIERELNNTRNKQRENRKFLKMLEEEEGTFFDEFSPRRTSSKNKERIEEINKEINDLDQTKAELSHRLEFINRRVDAVTSLIDKELKGKDNEVLIQQLKTIQTYIIQDPTRAKIEIDQIIKNLL